LLGRAWTSEEDVDNLIDAAKLLKAPDRQHADVETKGLHAILVALGMAGDLRAQGKRRLAGLRAEPEVGS